MGLYIFLGWIVIAICSAALAERKNRSVIGWFFLTLLFPIVILILLCLDKREIERMVICPYCSEIIHRKARACKHCGKEVTPIDEARAIKEAEEAQTEQQRKTRECPYCAEEILVKAKKCKHCGSEVEPIENEDEAVIEAEDEQVEQGALQELEPEKPSKTCQHCGAKNDISWKECSRCFKELTNE